MSNIIKANPLTCIRKAIHHLGKAYMAYQNTEKNDAKKECMCAIALIQIAVDNIIK